MKSKKYKLSAIVFYSAIIALAVVLPNMAFALQAGDFTYTEVGGTITITKYTGTGGAVVIPATIADMPVVYIGYEAFRGCIGLKSVTIPNSVTSIGNYAFISCTDLISVTIGNGVTSIGDYAFEYCYGLTSVTIPDSVTSIGDLAFAYCYGLTSVNIGNSVARIWAGAFYGCNSLTSVTIPSSVTSIGRVAFSSCLGLTSIVVEASNTVYSSQDGVLYNKAKTVLIQYPAGKSGEFTIPDSVTSIEASAFQSCNGLTSVTIPDSVTGIGSGAFYSCSGLTSVNIPNSITSIENQTFYNCTSLTSIIIPISVTSIGDWAFDGCVNLTSAYFYGNAPKMSSYYVFGRCASGFTVYYLAGNTGFSNPWCPSTVDQCYPAAVFDPSATTTTVTITTSTTTSYLADCVVFVSLSPPEGGTTNPPPGSYFIQGCTTRCMTFAAIPNPGYLFSHWNEGGEISTVNPHTVCGWGEAVFEKIPTTTTTIQINIINATSLRKQLFKPMIRDQKIVWMILFAAGHHFNQHESRIMIIGPSDDSQGVSFNEQSKALSIDKIILIPLTIQKGATPGEWRIEIATLLSNPVQEEQLTATFTIR